MSKEGESSRVPVPKARDQGRQKTDTHSGVPMKTERFHLDNYDSAKMTIIIFNALSESGKHAAVTQMMSTLVEEIRARLGTAPIT